MDYVYQPTRVLKGIHELLEEYRSGNPSDRKESPALLHHFSGGKPHAHGSGDRYHMERPASERKRPRPQMVK